MVKRIDRVDPPRETSETGNTADQYSYNCWRYGEEASLYSIAENSREDRASEAGTLESGTSNPYHGPIDEPATPTIEVQWAPTSDISLPDSWTPASNIHNLSKPTTSKIDDTDLDVTHETDNDDDSEPVCYNRNAHNSRRSRLVLATVVTFLIGLAIALGVSLSNRNRTPAATPAAATDTDNRGGVGSEGGESADKDSQPDKEPVNGGSNSDENTEEEEENADQVDANTDKEDANADKEEDNGDKEDANADKEEENSDKEDDENGNAPDEPSEHQGSPTSAPTADYMVLVKNFVASSLSNCGEEKEFLDETSLQYEVFLDLVDYVLKASTVHEDGTIDFPLDIGPEVIQERYGLIMLYKTAGGPSWNNNDNWLTNEDVCEWAGVQFCSERIEGSCAALSLNLSKLSFK